MPAANQEGHVGAAVAAALLDAGHADFWTHTVRKYACEASCKFVCWKKERERESLMIPEMGCSNFKCRRKGVRKMSE